MTAALVARGIVRGLHVAAALLIFGSTLCYASIASIALRQASSGIIRRVGRLTSGLIRLSLVTAALAGAIWLVLEAVYITGGDRLADGIAVLGPVLYETNFGHLLLVRLALLLLAVVVFGGGASGRRAAVAAGMAGVAVALQAGLGHGAAMGGAGGGMLLVSLVFHLLAAGAWLGGLVALLILVDALPPTKAREAALRFSTLGIICVLALMATTAVQGWHLVGGIAAWFGSAYGRIALAKLMLFVLLLGFAAANRVRFTPGLTDADVSGTRLRLHRSILAETLAGLLAIVLAGILANLPPNMTMPTDP